jgi:hypothetical protein
VARRVPVVGWVADTTSAFLNLFLRSKLRSRGNTSCPLLGFGHVLPLADGTVPYPGQLSIGSIDKSLWCALMNCLLSLRKAKVTLLFAKLSEPFLPMCGEARRSSCLLICSDQNAITSQLHRRVQFSQLAPVLVSERIYKCHSSRAL